MVGLNTKGSEIYEKNSQAVEKGVAFKSLGEKSSVVAMKWRQ